MNVRRAGINDAQAIAQVLKKIGWFTVLNSESIAESSARIDKFLARNLVNNNYSAFVVEDDNGELVGYTAVHWLSYLFMKGPEGFVSELFLAESARGKKMGTKLLAAVKTEAIERDCARLSLLNGQHRESYQRGFYEKQGWEERSFMVNFVFFF